MRVADRHAPEPDTHATTTHGDALAGAADVLNLVGIVAA